MRQVFSIHVLKGNFDSQQIGPRRVARDFLFYVDVKFWKTAGKISIPTLEDDFVNIFKKTPVGMGSTMWVIVGGFAKGRKQEDKKTQRKVSWGHLQTPFLMSLWESKTFVRETND